MVNLSPLLDHLPAWLMVLFRLTGIFLLAPVFGSATIPRTVKVFMIVALSLCVYPMLMSKGHTAAGSLGGFIGTNAAGQLTLSLWNLIPIVAVELLMGYVIGYWRVAAAVRNADRRAGDRPADGHRGGRGV